MTNSPFLGCRSFNSLYGLLERVTSTHALTGGTWALGQKPRCFIGSSSEDRVIARALSATIADFCSPSLWEFAFPPGRTAIEALEAELRRCQFAVLVVEPTDETISRGIEWGSPRDNVVFELGLFMGLLGRGRVFLLSPTSMTLKVPSDLNGVTRLVYRGSADRNDIRSTLVAAVEDLRQAINRAAP